MTTISSVIEVIKLLGEASTLHGKMICDLSEMTIKYGMDVPSIKILDLCLEYSGKLKVIGQKLDTLTVANKGQ